MRRRIERSARVGKKVVKAVQSRIFVLCSVHEKYHLRNLSHVHRDLNSDQANVNLANFKIHKIEDLRGQSVMRHLFKWLRSTRRNSHPRYCHAGLVAHWRNIQDYVIQEIPRTWKASRTENFRFMKIQVCICFSATWKRWVHPSSLLRCAA